MANGLILLLTAPIGAANWGLSAAVLSRDYTLRHFQPDRLSIDHALSGKLAWDRREY
jgi:hypothetical protein